MRINPNVDAATHPYIATGLHSTKFGIETEEALQLVPRILASDSLDLIGVACHIGSQLGSAAPLEEAVTLLGRFALTCRDLGADPASTTVRHRPVDVAAHRVFAAALAALPPAQR